MNGADGILSLPRGGGALNGLGEKFSADPQMGTGNFSVPIAVPPGRNGFQPALSLAYSTGFGCGPFGLGWTIDVPAIARRTSHGLPRYTAGDVFVLSGVEDLVPLGDESQPRTLYRPRTEGVFAEIAHDRSAGNDVWRVRTKDGLTSVFGTPGAAGSDPAAVARPGPATASRDVFAWRLTATTDPFGNRIEYEYDDLGDAPQRYVRFVRCVDFRDAAGATRFLVSVELEYEDRPDLLSERLAGFEVPTTKRCRQISVRTHADDDRLVKTYRLAYASATEGPSDARPRNGASQLTSITLSGHDGAATEQLPPLELGYTTFEPSRRDLRPIEGDDLPAPSLADPTLALVDLFGGGLPDIVEIDAGARFWRNRGDGRFDLPRHMANAPADVRLADPGVHLLDCDGNGRADLVVTGNGISGYFPLGSGGWDRRSFKRFRRAPNLEAEGVQLVDLTGDGVPDVIRAAARIEVDFGSGDDGWNGSRRLDRRVLVGFPRIGFDDSRVKWGDMSGDGLVDLVLVHDGSVRYWPSLGYGRWDEPVAMRGSPHFPAGYDPARILVGDVDGDGAADLVYVGDTRTTVWINRGGRGWSPPITIEGTPSLSDLDDVRLVDLFGTGVLGVLWSAAFDGRARPRMFFLDFTGGRKPYLLDRVDNHLGAVTSVEYAPSRHFHAEDARQRDTRWRTTLPFPVQVVRRVEVVDRISQGKLTTEYRYRHGHWDGEEKEFRGFALVEQFDAESFADHATPQSSPPALTRTWYHVGPVEDGVGGWRELDLSDEYWSGDPQLLERPLETSAFLAGLEPPVRRDAIRTLRGRVLRTEVYGRDDDARADRAFVVHEYLHGVGQPWPSASEPWEEHVFFPHLLAERTTRWERGDDPLTAITLVGDYDSLGRSRRQTQIALPRRAAKRRTIDDAVVGALEPDETRVLSSHTCVAYAEPDAGLYLHDRVAQMWTLELAQPPTVAETQLADTPALLQAQLTTAETIRGRFEQWQPGQALAATLVVKGHRVNHYDGGTSDAFVGRASGVGPYGALTRCEELVLTETLLADAYGARRPTYLGGQAALPAGAPAGFGSDLGYRFESGAGSTYLRGYYADVERRRFDFHQAVAGARGLVLATRTAVGSDTAFEPDEYGLLPIQVMDSASLKTELEQDYRVLQPASVTEPNGTATLFRYSPLGLLAKVAVQGPDGEGGTQDDPEVEYSYDFEAYLTSEDDPEPQPIFAHTRRRTRHASEQVPTDYTESRDYSDGFGRVVQRRVAAEALAIDGQLGLDPTPGTAPGDARAERVADRVVASGWQVLDNKGRAVETFEPFFTRGWKFQPASEASTGERRRFAYDALRRLVRVVDADGSEQRTLFGVPADLDDLDDIDPTPWERTVYDANDLAADAPAGHRFTPRSDLVDALGRIICTTSRNGPAAADTFVMRSSFDLRGNPVETVDGLGRTSTQATYDLLDRRLSSVSLDAGTVTTVPDAAGRAVEERGGGGTVRLDRHDGLGRLVRRWASDDPASPVTLRERLVYGDEGDPLTAKARNQLGRLVEHRDEAGVATIARYDFKGNVTERTRQVVSDAALLAGWTADWDAAGSANALATDVYECKTSYDALGRAYEVTSPEDVAGDTHVLTRTYTLRGQIARVELDGTAQLESVVYDARGQPALVAVGDGATASVMTRYAYDPATFRLRRCRSETCTRTDSATEAAWQGAATPIHDISYGYDRVGNVASIDDRTPDSGIAGSGTPDRLLRGLSYDALYRLVAADGRQASAAGATEAYSATFEYDPAGNLLKHKHAFGTTGGWTREHGYGGLPPGQSQAAPSNRSTSTREGGVTTQIAFDDAGNVIQQNTERTFAWDHAGRLTAFVVRPAGAAQPSVEERYLYDADGTRVKKWTRTGGTGSGESTVYLDGLFEHYVQHDGANPIANNQVHVLAGDRRIAMHRFGSAHPQDPSGLSIQYHLADHLGSSSVVLDSTGAVVDREEYAPYGETTYGSLARKRYRFLGRERDERTGLYRLGARYYAPWLARFFSCDPLPPAEEPNPYVYARDNPITRVDPMGRESAPAPTVGPNDPEQEWEPWPGPSAQRAPPEPDKAPDPSPRAEAIIFDPPLTTSPTLNEVLDNTGVGALLRLIRPSDKPADREVKQSTPPLRLQDLTPPPPPPPTDEHFHAEILLEDGTRVDVDSDPGPPEPLQESIFPDVGTAVGLFFLSAALALVPFAIFELSLLLSRGGIPSGYPVHLVAYGMSLALTFGMVAFASYEWNNDQAREVNARKEEQLENYRRWTQGDFAGVKIYQAL